MNPAPLAQILRIGSANMQAYLDKALQHEIEDVISGSSDCQEDSLELHSSPTCVGADFGVLPVHPAASSRKGSRFVPLPPKPGKAAKDKFRRQMKRGRLYDDLLVHPRHSLSKKYPMPQSLAVTYDAASLPASTGCWVGRQQPSGNREWALKELHESNYQVFPWDGCTSVAILDEEDRIMGVLAGRPQDEGWESLHTHMSKELEDAGKLLSASRQETRRGQYFSLSVGVSHGGGRKAPSNISLNKSEEAIVQKLKEDKAFQRAAGFMNQVFSFYAPKLYQEYHKKLKLLYQSDSKLTKAFGTVFPAATFNCGARVVTLEHVDGGNLPFGLCAIFACGSYDPTTGGHLILFDLNLAIQFPPGSTILIPSATLRHGNAAIQAHERRQSFTQFCPGGLFRWVDYGFKAVKSSPAELQQHFADTHKDRVRYSVGLFSKLGELEKDRREAIPTKGST